jgi:dCTP deaminase
MKNISINKLNSLYKFDISGKEGGILEPSAKYLIEIEECLSLPIYISGYANPKSSVGRCNIQVKLVTEGGDKFDKIEEGYDGKLFVEVTSKSFITRVKKGISLSQIRFYHERMEDAKYKEDALRSKLSKEGHTILYDSKGNPININDIEFDEDGAVMTSHVIPDERGIVGFVAKKDDQQLILDMRKSYEGKNPQSYFFNPLKPKDSAIKLVNSGFYLMPTKEFVSIPVSDSLWLASEMIPYDVPTGEFRSHSAGFIDYGFGCDKKGKPLPAPLMMEITPHDDIILTDGERICRIVFYKIYNKPKRFYMGHYQGQRLSTGKYFNPTK